MEIAAAIEPVFSMTEAKTDPPPGVTWIASYPKSGNTWVRFFLGRLFQGDGFSINIARHHFPYMLNYILVDKDYTQVDLDSPAVVEEVAAQWIPIQKLIRYGDFNACRGRLFLKTHTARVNINGHSFTNAEHTDRAIYIIRDPRDVLVSLSHYYDLTLSAAADLMLHKGLFPRGRAMPEFWGDWALNVASWRNFKQRPLLLLRYEDLLADPGVEFRRLLDFLGWTDPDAEIEAAIADTQLDALQRQEREHGFAEKPIGEHLFFRRGVAGGWKEHPDQASIRRIEDKFGETMASLGYA
ncbi:MAG: sulfotransferase domain-containing protein [Pseudomonadota bacterium]